MFEGEVESALSSAEQEIVKQLKNFVNNWREKNVFVYRDQLLHRIALKEYFLEVNLDDLQAFDESLADLIRKRPRIHLKLFETAVHQLAMEKTNWQINRQSQAKQKGLPPFQIVLTASANPQPIRHLTGEDISKLVVIEGIVINASRPRPRATTVSITCRNCRHTKEIKVKDGFTSVMLPKTCDRGMTADNEGNEKVCPKDPYVVLGDKCQFVDEQQLKLQENPESVPTGEMPRHVTLQCERHLVERAVPGNRVTVYGIFTIFHNKQSRRKEGLGAVAIRNPYIKVLGIEIDSEGGRAATSFSPEEEEEFRQLAKNKSIYEFIWKSIAPAIFGHTDIKKAIACLLFGGSRKQLPDGMKLRGDINVLLLGDPGTAKSQFLKFVQKVAPIGVYTSGKGSSAAGLTASVIRESGTRQFYLEGGAMVLADGGVVCIDEFDKMDLHDRVAIHEAMEQQTISIAKAGITTILNSRTSVLAAANPVFGSYDDSRSPFENIEFQSTILSRFDMIFLVRDTKDASRDKEIARHVISVHSRMNNIASRRQLSAMSGGSSAASAAARMTGKRKRGAGGAPMVERDIVNDAFEEESHIRLPFLKRYIAFCRQHCAPRLSAQAADILRDHYVSLRASVRGHGGGGNGPAIPITVRQLEAIVRISEALAKMQLSTTVSEGHVREAIRLFTVSTVEAAAAGKAGDENLPAEVWQEIQRVEESLRRRLPIGSTVSLQRIKEGLARGGAFSDMAIAKAVDAMVAREELEYLAGRKKIRRKR
ncbi:minichromosome maintenance protein 5 [Balamuthia mandrillaris]